MMRTAAILLAGGAGTRLKRSENKVYLPIGDRPLLAWSLAAFQRSPVIDEIVLVIRPVDRDTARRVLDETGMAKLRAITHGGATRQDSELAGLEVLAGDIAAGEVDLVLIHDAARPFVSSALIERVAATARATGGAVPALPIPHPVVKHTEDDRVEHVPLEQLRRVQTPQGFRAGQLLEAYRRAAAEGFSGPDTTESVTRYSGLAVDTVDGDPRNVKVTFVEDLFLAEELAAQWDELRGDAAEGPSDPAAS